MPSITSLKTAEEVSQSLKGMLSPERLIELAEAGLAPHYRVDEDIYFQIAEIKGWVDHNWIVRHPGQYVGDNFATIINIASLSKPSDLPPVSLRAVAGLLVPLPVQSIETTPVPGVYFLVADGEVVYVGQSGNAISRAGSHLGTKTYDSGWFMRVAPSDLLLVEGEFIRALKPKYNYTKPGSLLSGYGDGEPPSQQSEMIIRTIHEGMKGDA